MKGILESYGDSYEMQVPYVMNRIASDILLVTRTILFCLEFFMMGDSL